MVTSTTATSIGLAWTDNAGNEDGFQIYRSSGGGAFTLVGSVAADTAPRLRSSLTPIPASRPASPTTTKSSPIISRAPAIRQRHHHDAVVGAEPGVRAAEQQYGHALLYRAHRRHELQRLPRHRQRAGNAAGLECEPRRPMPTAPCKPGVTYFYYVTAVNANAVPAPNESAPSNEASPASGTGGAFQWTGSGTDNNWTTPGNWLGGVAPSGNANETLIFPAGASQFANVDNFPAGVEFLLQHHRLRPAAIRSPSTTTSPSAPAASWSAAPAPRLSPGPRIASGFSLRPPHVQRRRAEPRWSSIRRSTNRPTR